MTKLCATCTPITVRVDGEGHKIISIAGDLRVGRPVGRVEDINLQMMTTTTTGGRVVGEFKGPSTSGTVQLRPGDNCPISGGGEGFSAGWRRYL